MKIGIVALFIVSASQASAEPPVLPDPSTIVLPDMRGDDPRVVRNGWKHFYFHRAGVSYAQAFADFTDCYRFLPVGNTSGKLPTFVPWVDRQTAKMIQPVNNYGLVGLAIGALVEGPIVRRAYQSRMRRCLEPRGYTRYPVSEDSWRQLVGNYSAALIPLQAKAASMPTPTSQPVSD